MSSKRDLEKLAEAQIAVPHEFLWDWRAREWPTFGGVTGKDPEVAVWVASGGCGIARQKEI